MVLCFFTLLLTAQADSPPGAELPNKDELLRAFREHVSRFLQPQDHFRIRRVQRGGFLEAETVVEVQGDYRKRYSRSNTGVEWVTVLTPADYVNLVRYPGEDLWKFADQGETTAKQLKKMQENWLRGDHFLGYGELRFVSENVFENPNWTFTKVTAERDNGVPIYRFHYSRVESTTGLGGGGGGGSMAKSVRTGHFDVDPALSWAVVAARERSDASSETYYERRFIYEGTFGGLPAVKRVEVGNRTTGLDGKVRYQPHSVTETVELVEQAPFVASEFSFTHYGLKPPYLIYVGLAAAGLLAIGWIYVLRLWLRQRRRHGMSWSTGSE